MAGRRIELSGLQPHLDGLRWEFQDAFRIGRNPKAEIVLNDASVSGLHAEILPTAQGWVVRDLGNTSGTSVNGIRVDKKMRALQPNDLIVCGKLRMRVAALERDIPLPVPDTLAPSNVLATGRVLTIQAVAKRSWEEGLEGLAQHDDDRLPQGKHFLTLLRGGYHLSHIASLDELLQLILGDTVAVLGAQRGCILLVDPLTGELSLRGLSMEPKLKRSEKHFSRSLIRRCFKEGQSLLCRDVNTEADLQTAQSIMAGGMASIICALVRSPRKRLGILHLDRGPLQEQFNNEDLHLADAIAASISVGIESAQLFESQRWHFLNEMTALARRACGLHDPALEEHAQRVVVLSQLLAEALQLPADERQQIQLGAPLHDVGKLALDNALLRKAGKFSAEEFDQVKTHPLKGVALIGPVVELSPAIPVIRSHHERWDGGGYPDGLIGEKIPRAARVVAVANAFASMTSEQTFRPALSADQAFAELADKAGSQFDPECVTAFLKLRSRIEGLQGKSPDARAELGVSQQFLPTSAM